jgi:prevent-host-death family protein
MDVGVRELKQHLSDYLDRAQRGETIRVTDRGTPKVLITPISDSGSLETGIEDGWIRPASRVGLQPVRRVASLRAIRDVLAEDRDE